MAARIGGAVLSACIAGAIFFVSTALAATYIGTPGPDNLGGTNQADTFQMGAGNDIADGFGGNDSMFMGQNADIAYGAAGNDHIEGRSGNDGFLFPDGSLSGLHGMNGSDVVLGGVGHDYVAGGYGSDPRVSGQEHNDTVQVNDGYADTVYAGSGVDSCYADFIDVLNGCEYIYY